MGFVHFLESHVLPCPSRALLHFDCPGCGMQRSFIYLLKGDLLKSLAMHPGTIPMLSLVVYALLHFIFRFSKGAKIIVFLQLSVAIITMVFYIYKIVSHKIF